MATIPFNYDCDRWYGFVTDPNVHARVGYLVALEGLGLSTKLAADLTVSLPFNTSAGPLYKYPDFKYVAPTSTAPIGKVTVVGVIEKFEWLGGVGDPVAIDFYVSQENAGQIRALQRAALKTTTIKTFAWWIADYDQESKVWFEQAFPLDPGFISGVVNTKENLDLNVNLNPVKVKDGEIDVNVYKIHISVAPAANNQYKLHFADSNQKNVIRSWGVVVGTVAKTVVPR